MGRRPSLAYAPKAPADRVLNRIVRDHFETFRLEAAHVYERDALPRFIEEEPVAGDPSPNLKDGCRGWCG